MLMQPLDSYRLLLFANLSMALGVLLLLLGIAGAYVVDDQLQLGAVVASHALVILGPTALKIGYVMRLRLEAQ